MEIFTGGPTCRMGGRNRVPADWRPLQVGQIMKTRTGENMGKETGRKPTHRNWDSVHGVVRKNSLIRDVDGITAGFVTQSGDMVRIRAKRHSIVEKIRAAAESGDTVIFQGRQISTGTRSNDYLRVLFAGPVELNGVVYTVRRVKNPVWPKVYFQMIDERISRDGAMYRIRTPVSVYGPRAEALEGICVGTRVHLSGRLGPEGYMPISPVTLNAPLNWLERAKRVLEDGSLAHADPW